MKTDSNNTKTDNLVRLRHSLAHVMAQAVCRIFGVDKVKLGIGPPITDGFYYDFELPRTITEEDLVQIEAQMRALLKEDHPFVEEEKTVEEMKQLFNQQPYKLDVIERILSAGLDPHGQPLPEGEKPRLTVYRHGDFTDLCGGPHLASTGQIHPQAFKLTKVAGAYWRGDSQQPMLQRIYGTGWPTPQELEQYLDLQAEAERRDHRRLGKELELFHLDATAPGFPYWLPHGRKLFQTLVDFWRQEHDARGYEEFAGPLVNERALWSNLVTGNTTATTCS